MSLKALLGRFWSLFGAFFMELTGGPALLSGSRSRPKDVGDGTAPRSRRKLPRKTATKKKRAPVCTGATFGDEKKIVVIFVASSGEAKILSPAARHGDEKKIRRSIFRRVTPPPQPTKKKSSVHFSSELPPEMDRAKMALNVAHPSMT